MSHAYDRLPGCSGLAVGSDLENLSVVYVIQLHIGCCGHEPRLTK